MDCSVCRVRALALLPTKELAQQVKKRCSSFPLQLFYRNMKAMGFAHCFNKLYVGIVKQLVFFISQSMTEWGKVWVRISKLAHVFAKSSEQSSKVNNNYLSSVVYLETSDHHSQVMNGPGRKGNRILSGGEKYKWLLHKI